MEWNDAKSLSTPAKKEEVRRDGKNQTTLANSARFSQIIHAIFVNIILRIELITIFFMEVWLVVVRSVHLPSRCILNMMFVQCTGSMTTHSTRPGLP
jgi:hypothetical protein